MKSLNTGIVEANLHRKKPAKKTNLVVATPPPAAVTKSLLSGEFREIPLNLIDPCKHPVRRVENWLLEELGMSITNDGLYSPVIVRPEPAGRFEVVAGSHRYATIQQNYKAQHEQDLANYSRKPTIIPLVPCIIRNLNDVEARLVSIAGERAKERPSRRHY